MDRRHPRNIFAYANNIHTVEGGTHLSGLKIGADPYAQQLRAARTICSRTRTLRLEGDDTREGLVAIVSVKLAEPQFEGQTKTKLGNSEVEGLVSGLVNEKLGEYFEKTPGERKGSSRGRSKPRRARSGAQGQGAGAPQGRAGFGFVAGQARRLPGARPRAERIVYRRGRFGRRFGQAGTRPPGAGDPAATRENPQRRARADRQGAVVGRVAHADHRARDGHR